jgi:hypothetical protein
MQVRAPASENIAGAASTASAFAHIPIALLPLLAMPPFDSVAAAAAATTTTIKIKGNCVSSGSLAAARRRR